MPLPNDVIQSFSSGRDLGKRRNEMEGLFFEAFLIALLILLNGYLAGTEIAVVTARKSTSSRWLKAE